MSLFGLWTGVLLCLSCTFWGFRLLRRGGDSGGTAGVGLLIVAIAAGFGAARFAGIEGVAVAAAGLTRLASGVGVPMVGAAWFFARFAPQLARQGRPPVFGSLLIGALLLTGWPAWPAWVGGVSLALAALAAVGSLQRAPRGAAAGLVGVLMLAFAGGVVGGPGDWLGLSRAGWFQLSLMVGLLSLAWGLLRVECGLA